MCHMISATLSAVFETFSVLLYRDVAEASADFFDKNLNFIVIMHTGKNFAICGIPQIGIPMCHTFA